MTTQIHLTRKLEKTVGKYISKETQVKNEYLEKWSANIFYVDRKKCWILVNSLTKYSLLLSDLKSADIKNFSKLFKETFYSQLIYDGIIVEYKLIETIIGDVKLKETDNDRSANGSLNNSMYTLDYWKYEYGSFENMNFRDLNHRLNINPNQMLNYKYPKDEMNDVIKAFA